MHFSLSERKLMRLLTLTFALVFLGLSSNASWAAPPAPWALGPSGERSVIGGRSIRKPGLPAKLPVGKGTVGTLNVITIRAQFDANGNGVEETPQGDDFFDAGNDKAFFESRLTTVSQYYSDVSEGLLTLNFTVSGLVYTLSHDMGYYGDPARGDADSLIIDAVLAADADIDFSQYDAVMVIHAGVGEESLGQGDTPTYIWSQRVSFPPISVDGVDVSGGTVVPEKEQFQGSSIVGVIAHEFGHELGLPDLYDVDGTSRGIGDWGLMGTGAWGNNGATPSEFEAWSKIFLGWASVTTLSSSQTGYALPPTSEGNQVVKVNARGYPDSEEYFLLEYRRQTSWDQFLPGEGLLIWHIDEDVGRLAGFGCSETRWECNEVNDDENHKLVDLEEADGLNDLDNNVDGGDAGDPFAAGRTFTATTTPNSRNYAGQETGVFVSNISSPGQNMTFDLSMGFLVKSVSLVDANTVDVEYNRAANTSPTASNYTLSSIDGTGSVNASSATRQTGNVTVRLSFTAPINGNNIYRLTVNNERDTNSNSLQFNPTAIDNPFGANAAGVLNGHAVWTAAGSPYYVTGNLIIDNHLSLTITEGAVVRIKKLTSPGPIDIKVSGTLTIQGSASKPVLITSAGGGAAGDWGTFKFRSEADDMSSISHAVLEYGTRGVTLSSASPSITATTFRNFSEAGVILFGDSAPSITGNTFSDNVKGVQAQETSSPLIKGNLFSGETESGVVFFGTTSATVDGNTFSGNFRGITCWENSRPRITRNLITGNQRGLVCGNSAIPTIIGNSFDGNIEIGLSTQEQVGALNPTVVGNSFINHSGASAFAIYTFTNPLNAPHNYFNNNKFNVGGQNTATHIGQQLANPVDPGFSPTAILFEDPTYGASVSFMDPGSQLYLQLQGTGADASSNSAVALVKSSATDTTGIYVHLDETGGSTGIYRTAESPETLASIGASTDQTIYRLGAVEGETVSAIFAADPSISVTAAVTRCLRGDADLNSSLNIMDIVSLLRISISLEPQPQTLNERCSQDVDGSGAVDILDAIGAGRILLGL